jgi:hypothetical protein
MVVARHLTYICAILVIELVMSRRLLSCELSIKRSQTSKSKNQYKLPIPVMPRPSQPGSIRFDGTDITEFLDDWDLKCDLSDAQKCTHLPNYCTPAIKDLVKLLPGYLASDSTALQASLKETYWQHDKPKNTHEALIKLIKEVLRVDLNVYIIKFTAITDSFISKRALSCLDSVGRLLDGLQSDLRFRDLKFCVKNSWRLSSNDTGTGEPDFGEFKEFVLTESKAAQKQAVYNTEQSIHEGIELQWSMMMMMMMMMMIHLITLAVDHSL